MMVLHFERVILFEICCQSHSTRSSRTPLWRWPLQLFHHVLQFRMQIKVLPFEPLIPNAETIEAIKAARRGKLTKVGHPDGLLESLNADD